MVAQQKNPTTNAVSVKLNKKLLNKKFNISQVGDFCYSIFSYAD